jgi:RNA polymerase-associated protein
MSKEEYDKATADLVSYLVWMGEPMAETRKTIGTVVLAFLALRPFLSSQEELLERHSLIGLVSPMQSLAATEQDAPRARRVVRDSEYPWGNTTMMNLYSGTTDPFSHRCRIVLFEKGMDFQVIDVDLFNKPEDIAVINPYNRVPVLVDRDLVLYESNIINEYIDERFPHPQLMPPDPIMRARARQLLHTFELELFSHIEALEKNPKGAEKERAHVRDS